MNGNFTFVSQKHFDFNRFYDIFTTFIYMEFTRAFSCLPAHCKNHHVRYERVVFTVLL